MNYKFQNLSVLLIFMIFLAGTISFGQQQINNPGFENWEEIRSEVEEPVNWNSIKNTDGSRATKRLAPEVASRTEVAHSGKYALKLVNKSTMGIVANGIISNGAIHGEMDKSKSYLYTDASQEGFSTPFTSRPDSVIGWYKYAPSGNDSCMVVILLHNGYVTMPDHGTKSCWVGYVRLILPSTNGDNWVRFSAPFFYVKDSKPEYLLMALSAGNRQHAVEGSVALFDDIQLIYNKPK